MIYFMKERIVRKYLALLFYIFVFTLVGCKDTTKKPIQMISINGQESNQKNKDIEEDIIEESVVAESRASKGIEDENELKFDSFESLTLENVDSYPIRGRCLSSLGSVSIATGQSAVEHVLDCEENNTFSGIFDMREITSDHSLITATQGSKTITNSSIENEVQYFVSEWKFDGENYLFVFPIKENLKYNFIIDWGDGSSQNEVTSFDDPDKSHTYTKPGNYIITVMGLCEGFENARGNRVGPDADHLVKVLNLGHVGWKDLSYAFSQNQYLTDFFGGNTSQVTNMSYMFYGAYEVTPNVNGWDTSQVTDMSYMFNSALLANLDVSDWDTSQVTNMSYMFSNADRATPDVSDWNTSQVTDMSSMFSVATIINPDVSDWDTSQVTNMSRMFYHSRSANPYTATWDLSRIQSIESIFDRSTNLSLENYSIFLRVAAQMIPEDAFGPKSIGSKVPIKVQYNVQAKSSRSILLSRGWTINDAGLISTAGE